MERLELNHFKAFNNELSLENDGAKNVLLFGENGAGKSSLFSSLEYIFYRHKIESVNPMLPTADQQAELDAIRESYKNSQARVPFDLKFNGVDVFSVNTGPYQVFLLNRFDKAVKITLYGVLSKNYFPADIDVFLDAYSSFIIQNVNLELSQSFFEPIEISLVDKENGYVVILKNTDTHLSRSQELDKYFNEAIINLVQLLIWFSSVQLIEDMNKRRIIVLDDFITSLDAANRAYMMRYLLKTFSTEQLIILTHDYSLFNLTVFLIEHVYYSKDKWNQYKLYRMGDSHCLELIKKISTNDLRKELHHATTYDNIGNKVRKCFEQRLYDLAAELSVGQLEKTSNIIDCIENSKNVYYKSKTSLSDLVTDIESMLSTIPDAAIRQPFIDKINEFKIPEAQKLKETVKLLCFYQKIAMHPMSHGFIGVSHYYEKGVEECIKLLDQLDRCVKGILDGRI